MSEGEARRPRARRALLAVAHRAQELGVALRLAHLREQQLHRLDWRQRRQHLAEDIDAIEIFLSRELAERRIYPAIDIPKSGTRKEEKLIAPGQITIFQALRRILVQMPPQEAMLKLVDRLNRTKTNDEFFNLVKVGES